MLHTKTKEELIAIIEGQRTENENLRDLFVELRKKIKSLLGSTDYIGLRIDGAIGKLMPVEKEDAPQKID
jgi:hypothetical protein